MLKVPFSYLRHNFCLNQLYTHSNRFLSSMQAWQCYDYNGINSLELTKTARVPTVQSVNDVLIKVEAASVNPIDVEMTGGFGKVFIGALRNFSNYSNRSTYTEFPATFGRDVSGIVVECGKNCNEFKPGDEVWGNVPVFQPGSHAEYTVTTKDMISKKPKNLSHVEAASIPYICLTALSALVSVAGLKSSNLSHKRILVLGGSGGVGTFAIQWLKYKGAYVATTGSPDAAELLIHLGADMAINYQDENYLADLISQNEKFDVILDAVASAGKRDDYSALMESHGKYVTLTFPMLDNANSYGLLGGLGKTTLDFLSLNMQSFKKGYKQLWAVAAPHRYKHFTKEIQVPFESGKIVPIIHKVFSFSEIPAAYKALKQGHARGKIVIDMDLHRQEDKQSSATL